MVRRRQSWKDGAYFLVPQKDGRSSVGQVLDRMMPNVVRCALYSERIENGAAFEGCRSRIHEETLIALLATTRDLLDEGRWEVVGAGTATIDMRRRPHEALREKGWIGARVVGSGIVEDFLNAFFCLEPWDAWKDPNYLDSLLVSPEKKPKRLILSAPARHG